MKVELKNKIFIFNNTYITQKKYNNNICDYIGTGKDFKSYIPIQKLNTTHLKYDTFIHILKNSLDIYIDINNYRQVMDECFNYFKISTNPLIKRNMSEKISYIVIESFLNENYEPLNELRKTLDNYLMDQISAFNYCEELIYLKIIANIDSVKKEESNNIFNEDDSFTLYDFILDFEY